MEYNYEDNTKIRIVLLLNYFTNKKIKKYNKKINKGITHKIEFSKNCYPHITLISGVLKNKIDFDKISTILTNKIKEIIKNKLIINFDKFYYSEDNEWLFVGVEENAMIAEFIASLRENLAPYITISDARHLHVTIAKSEELQSRKEIINNFKLPKKYIAKNIAVGLSGNNGILLNIIKKYKIN